MKAIFKWIIRFRKAIILITLLITLILGYFIKDLKINPDITSTLPKDDPAVKLFNYIGEEFGGSHLAVVGIETEKSIFNIKTIEDIRHLTAEFNLLDGVSYVTSLTNVIDIKKGEDGIEIGKLIDEYNMPDSEAEILKLKEYILSKDMYRGKIISGDSKTTIIICRLRDDVDKIQTAKEIKEIVKKTGMKETFYYGGLPFQMLDISVLILKDIKLLIPFVFFIIALILFLSFRSWHGVIFPVISIVISITWTLGVMGILKIPVTAITNIIPVILVAVGSAYSIHVMSKYNETVKNTGDDVQQSIKALGEIGVPVILAALTTMMGFIAFVFGSYLSMIREFGIFSSLGIFFAMLVSLTFLPAAISASNFKKNRGENENKRSKGFFIKFMDNISLWVLLNEKTIIIAAILIALVSIIGIPNIQRKVDMLDYFRRDSNIRMTEKMMEEKFGGSIPIQIFVKGDIQDPDVLNKMKQMENFLDSKENIRNSQSIADLIEEMNDVMGEGKAIPNSKYKVSNLWFLLEGEEILSQLVNEDKTEAVIQATLTTVNTQLAHELVKDVENQIEGLNDSKVSFFQTGMPIIYESLDKSIVKSQIQSLIAAGILIFICMAIMLRSFLGGIIGLTPIAFTLLIIFGFMGITGIPLDIATVLVGSISIGIGIDYVIHFISRFKKEFKKNNSEREALDKTLETTGKAILINVITVTFGFLVLVFAEVVPLQRFGSLVAITMICSGSASIILLPAIIMITKANFVGNFDKIADNFKKGRKG